MGTAPYIDTSRPSKWYEMKICYLSGGQNVPTVRFRLPFFDLLRDRGHVCHVFHAYPSRYDYYPWIGWKASQALRKAIRNWHLLRIRTGGYDTVVLETGLFHTNDFSYEKRLRSVASRLVFEIDDAVFLLFPEKCEYLAKMADHVIAGNEALATWARNYNSQVSIVSTCVDERLYIPKDYELKQEVARPIVGWIGSSGNVPMLSIPAAALRKLATKIDFELRVITSQNHRLSEVDLAGVNVKWIDINLCDVVGEIHKLDIGIMPLSPDDPWMQYKCNAKMIQYMAVGLPAIGSAVGFNFELISNSANGMLAANVNEWEHNLRQLLESPSLRRTVGEAGRRSVIERFTVQSQIVLYERILDGTEQIKS